MALDCPSDGIVLVDDIINEINTHTADTNNPHGVTKAQIGLDKVENIVPADMPISDDTQIALDGKEDYLGTPDLDGKILSSKADGTREWIEYSTATWGDISGDINNQTDLVDELNRRVLKTGDRITGDLEVDGVLTSSNILADTDTNDNSCVTFQNISGGSDTKIFWNNTTRRFEVQDLYGTNNILLHSGNVNPDDYVKKSGSIMTGALILSTSLPTMNLEAAPKEYVDMKFKIN